MSDYNPNSSNRGSRGHRRRRGGKRRHNEAYDSRDSREPRSPKVAPPSGFQKFLSIISFGLLGQKPVSKSYASGAPQPIRTPREPSSTATSSGSGSGSGSSSTREPRQERGDREPRREKRERSAPISTEVNSERLYVGNLSYDATESDLFELFNGSGQVKNAEVVVNNRTQRSKGFAFVTMNTVDDAKKAVADLNGKDFMGRPLVVGGAKPMAPREERGDRYERGGHNHDEHQDSHEPSSSPQSSEEHHNASV